MTTSDGDERETDALLAEIRSLEPPPGVDPPWDQMARDIFAACDALDARRPRGSLAAARRLVSPQRLVVGAVAAVAAVALVVLIRGGAADRTPAAAPVALTAQADAGAPTSPPTGWREPELVRAAALEDMNPEELSLLADALSDPATLLDLERDEDGVIDDDDDGVLDSEPVLGPGVVAEAETAEDDDPTGNELPGYEHLLDDLSDTALDDLDAAIDAEQPG